MSFNYDDGIPVAAVIEKGDKSMTAQELVYFSEDTPILQDKTREEIRDLLVNHAFRKLKTNKRVTAQDLDRLVTAYRDDHIDPSVETLYELTKPLMDEIASTELVDNDHEFFPLPIIDKDLNNRIFIAGPSGSGKSYFIGNFIKQYHKMYPDKRIIIVSPINEDKNIDVVKDIIKVDLDEDFKLVPPTVDKFANSLTIFDDIYGITDIKLRNSVFAVKDAILQNGRHDKIDVITSSHLLNDQKYTKKDIFEANGICIFHKASNAHFINYFTKNYLGLDKFQHKKFTSMPGRWVFVKPMLCPKVLISADEITTL